MVREPEWIDVGAAALAGRCLELAGKLVAAEAAPLAVESGGRKGRPVIEEDKTVDAD